MNSTFKKTTLACAIAASVAVAFFAVQPAEAQRADTPITLVSGPITWEAEPGARLRTTSYFASPPNPAPAFAYQARTAIAIQVEFERLTPEGAWVPSRSQTFHTQHSGQFRPGTFSVTELVQTGGGIVVHFDTHIVEEIEFVVEKVERARVMSVHQTHQFMVGMGDPVPSVSTTKAVRNAVWKEFSPAEEQLKGNPRH